MRRLSQEYRRGPQEEVCPEHSATSFSHYPESPFWPKTRTHRTPSPRVLASVNQFFIQDRRRQSEIHTSPPKIAPYSAIFTTSLLIILTPTRCKTDSAANLTTLVYPPVAPFSPPASNSAKSLFFNPSFVGRMRKILIGSDQSN
jgi:hypothetical protein